MRRVVVSVAVLILVLAFVSGIEKYIPKYGALQLPNKSVLSTSTEKVKIVTEESVTVDAVKKTGPSVVTVSALPMQSSSPRTFEFSPFGGFFNSPDDQSIPQQPQSIGSGFIVSDDGLIVTNKHVVSDTNAKYQIVTANDKKYDVQKIYRDPLNDIAILKVDLAQNIGMTLQPITLGDSSKLQVGQFVIAIGTALGQFRNTVTTGVISGLGRGITAGSEFEGSVEKLDNVIQTNAAINPGNSGGPLLNSAAQVIGVNTAVAQNGQNIGFALPINVIKDSLKNFNETGQFNRPSLGIAYKTIQKDVAILNDVPEGAYIQRVVNDSSAEKAGLKQGDIIVKIDDQRLDKDHELASIIAHHKPGDTIHISYWRDDVTNDTTATLTSAPNQ